MNKFIRFFKMKKEQKLMRSFDRLMLKIKKSDVAWYPDHCLGVDNSEMRIDNLMFEIGELKNEVKRLKLELDTYDLTNWL